MPTSAPADAAPDASRSWRDHALLDLPETEKATDPESGDASEAAERPDQSDQAYEQLRKLYGGTVRHGSDEPPERKIVWLFDIFLYPMNKAGMAIILICSGVPLLLRVFSKLSNAFAIAFVPMLTVFVLAVIVHWCALVIFLLYIHWYAHHCVEDSAAGGIRAPESAGSTPGFGELFGRAFRSGLCVLLYTAPALYYLARVRQFDMIFCTLYGLGGFLVPMALLAMTVFDSIRAINPVLVIASVLSTLIPYTALILFFYLPYLLVPVAFYCLFRYWTLGYLTLALLFYLILILAHLLGRFYYKYEHRLNWEA